MNQALNTYLQNQAFHVRLMRLPCFAHHWTYLNSLGFSSFKNFHTIAFYHSHKIFRSPEMFQMEDQERRLGTACFSQLQWHQLIPGYIPNNLARSFIHLVRSKTLDRNRKDKWVIFYKRNITLIPMIKLHNPWSLIPMICFWTNLQKHDSFIGYQNNFLMRHSKMLFIIIRQSKFWRFLENLSTSKLSTCLSKVKHHLDPANKWRKGNKALHIINLSSDYRYWFFQVIEIQLDGKINKIKVWLIPILYK